MYMKAGARSGSKIEHMKLGVENVGEEVRKSIEGDEMDWVLSRHIIYIHIHIHIHIHIFNNKCFLLAV